MTIKPGDRLKKARDFIGLTQAALGDRVGIKWYQVRDMESGKVEISTSLARLLRFEFKISEQWLLRGEGEMIVGVENVTEEMEGYYDADTHAILKMLKDMDQEAKRDVRKYTEKEKLLAQCRREKKLKEG